MTSFQLLDQFDWAEVPYTPPSERLSEELTPSLGFIGFETSSFVSNLGTSTWFNILYLAILIKVFLLNRFGLRKIKREAWRDKIIQQKKKMFYNDILSKLNDQETMLLVSAAI